MSEERLPVLRPGGEFCYNAPVEAVRELIREGKARPFGSPKHLRGCILHEGPARWHAGTKYVHQAPISESWTDRDGIEHARPALVPNVRGVYTLKRITHLDKALFEAVVESCLSSSA